MELITTFLQRFPRFTMYAGDCVVWTGNRSPNGYGRVTINKQTHYAHRLSYIAAYGPIPEGKELDHLCRNRACVNHGHLTAVTRLENTLRGNLPAVQRARFRAQTHCKKGHAFDTCNTYWHWKRSATNNQFYKSRGCRQCRDAATKKSKAGSLAV